MGNLDSARVYTIDKNKDLSGLTLWDPVAIHELFQRFNIRPTKKISFIDIDRVRIVHPSDNLFRFARFIQAYSDPDVSAFGIYLDRDSCGYEWEEPRCLIICNSCMRFNGNISRDVHSIELKRTLFEKRDEEEENRMIRDYLENDILATRDLVRAMSFTFDQPIFITVKPVKVIFNNPATIVIWDDGTKTIVKKQKGDRYDKEKGLALCYMKKALGNSSRQLNDALRKGLEE